MSLHTLRNQSWLRTALAALVLCFALGTIAYAGHAHQKNSARAHAVCEFCVGMGNLVDPPSPTLVAKAVQLTVSNIAIPKASFIAVRAVGVAQARAPPVVLN